MKMADYLTDVKFAVESNLAAIEQEGAKVNQLQLQLDVLTRKTQRDYLRAESLMNDPENDDPLLGAGLHWDTYFGADKDRFHKGDEYEAAKRAYDDKVFSIAAMHGTILQIAKQGISAVHGGRTNCPPGRSVGSLVLKDVIWQGRNQSMHWEEGKLRADVTTCFGILAKEQSQSFADYHARNLASDVARLLGWREWPQFEQDMLSLA